MNNTEVIQILILSMIFMADIYISYLIFTMLNKWRKKED